MLSLDPALSGRLHLGAAALRVASAGVRTFAATWLLTHHAGSLAITEGPSMLPTSPPGRLVIVDYLSRDSVQKGDFIMAVSPRNPTAKFGKRIIGMPGDRVKADPLDPDSPIIKVPPGRVWLQGDNLYDSLDSRHCGPIPLAMVQAKVRDVFGPTRAPEVFREPQKV